MDNSPKDLRKELDKIAPGDIYVHDDGFSYQKLDKSKQVVTSKCQHDWIEDEPRHWVCTKCGYGKYSGIRPS